MRVAAHLFSLTGGLRRMRPSIACMPSCWKVATCVVQEERNTRGPRGRAITRRRNSPSHSSLTGDGGGRNEGVGRGSRLRSIRHRAFTL